MSLASRRIPSPTNILRGIVRSLDSSSHALACGLSDLAQASHQLAVAAQSLLCEFVGHVQTLEPPVQKCVPEVIHPNCFVISGTRFVNGEAVKAVDGDGMADLVSIRCSLLSPTTIHCLPID